MTPYPKELETSEMLHGGVVVRLRPVRAEDGPLLQNFAAHMNAEDLRLRFFAPMLGLSHQLAERLSHIDDEHEMALMALADGAEETLGVTRFSADPHHRIAEFAIAVRSDWKGHGLGHLLMTRLIEVARQRGIVELAGEVLPENTAMMQLAREFGFTIDIDPNDPGLLRVSKMLQDAGAPTSVDAATEFAQKP